jgi:hypothetical protein
MALGMIVRFEHKHVRSLYGQGQARIAIVTDVQTWPKVARGTVGADRSEPCDAACTYL